MSELERVHSLLRDALADFVEVCNKYQIPYFMIEGSCLGTVRHQGFVPWDDDVDVAIPATYYDVFMKAYAEEFAEKYEVAGCFSWEDFPEKSNTLTRIYIPSVKMLDRSLHTEKVVHPFIDVMLIYGFASSPLKAKMHYYHIFVRKVLLKLSDRNTIGFNVGKHRKPIEKLVLNVLSKVDTSRLFNTRKCWEKLIKTLLRYSYDESAYVSIYPSDYRQREIMPKEYYGVGKAASFEGLDVNVPAASHEYLSQLYGDYMQLPPPEKRISHHKLTIIE